MSEPAIYALDLFGQPIIPERPNKLAEDFCVPPFSVLSSRDGWWQERKAAWASLGIKGEIGRSGNEESGSQSLGVASGTGRASALRLDVNQELAASIFDPVLCELSYRWYTPPGGMVLDPFAGGSVRGIVAAMLGRRYHGIDLRPEQTDANREQAGRICKDITPEWHTGCARELLPAAPPADFVFSCPPYFDLERYSDDPRDLSAMGWDGFVTAYTAIIRLACERLRPDRFACFVVGDVRDGAGNYRCLPELTVSAFAAAGLKKYNEAALVTPVGSLPVRVGKQFTGSRKLGKTHQNVLTFVKGCPKAAARLIPLEQNERAK